VADLVFEVAPAEVCDLEGVLAEEDVLRLDVSVDDGGLLLVQVLDCLEDVERVLR